MAYNDIDSNLVTTGSPVEGGCAWAAFGTPSKYPTSAAEKMSTLPDYKSLGDTTEDGYTASKSVTSTKFKGWHESVVLTKVSGEEHTFKVSLIETGRPEVAKLRYGSENVTAGADGSVSKISAIAGSGEKVSLVFDELEDTGFLRRTVIYRATVESFDDVEHKPGGLVTYGFTFSVEDDGAHPLYDIFRAKPAGSTSDHS